MHGLKSKTEVFSMFKISLRILFSACQCLGPRFVIKRDSNPVLKHKSGLVLPTRYPMEPITCLYGMFSISISSMSDFGLFSMDNFK